MAAAGAAVKQFTGKLSSGAVLGARAGTGSTIVTRTRTPCRTMITKPTGEYLPKPSRAPFGLLGITATVCAGLTLGATFSKNMASFLEENELFVPTDDDDDD